MEHTQVLEEYGLTRKEAKVYLAALELGLSKANEISRKAGIIRETTYSIIQSLVQKGLMSSVVKSGVKCFEAADPKRLNEILKEKERLINSIIPNLDILKKSAVLKPKVQFYEGREGLKTVTEDLLTTKEKKILAIVSNKHLDKMFKFYFPNLVRRRYEAGIRIWLLTDGKPITRKLLKFKNLPKTFELKTATYIYDNKVSLISLDQREPVGMIIENKAIADTQKNIFNLIWNLL